MSDKRDEMQISERELSAMTAELNDMHESTFPAVRKALDDVSANIAHLTRGTSATRRRFLLGAGGAVALGAAAACSNGTSSSGGGNSSAAAPPPSSSASPYTGDLRVVALATALENLAVTAYQGALQAAQAGKLGTIPPAIPTFVQTAMKQHADHANAWNAILQKSGKPTITNAPLTITQEQVNMLNQAKSVGDVAKQALALEQTAGQTYTFGIANVQDAGGIMTAAVIQPVEQMHAAILHYVLGQYPVPNTFVPTQMSLKPDMLTV